jgi:hypothetical protein
MTLPPAARSQISAALGADQPSYWARSERDGALELRNPALGLKASVTGSAITVSAASGLHFGLGAPSITRGTRTDAPVAMAASSAVRNRVTLAAGGLRESLTNGPAGIEQSFTIAKRPPGTGTLVISQAIAGGAVVGSAAGAITIGDGREALTYRDLLVTDARGHTVPASLAPGAGYARITIDDTQAEYPLHIDPLITPVEQQGEKLIGDCTSACGGAKGTGESGTGNLGYSVALSADGETALIGAPYDHGFSGAAWVFTRSGTTWSQQGESSSATARVPAAAPRAPGRAAGATSDSASLSRPMATRR